MNNYLFFFGNHPELALAELQSLLAFLDIDASYKSVSAGIYQVNTPEILPPIIDRLGGTIKIARVVNTLKYLDEKEIAKSIENNDKIFGLSVYNFSLSNFEVLKLSKRIKKIVKSSGSAISFVLPTDNGKISSAQNTKKIGHKGAEIVLMKVRDEFIVTRVAQAQNIDRWSYLDFGLPKSDPKKGMLPPKLAQIMINLGLSVSNCHPEQREGSKTNLDSSPLVQNDNKITFYDPFCGCGRIALQCALNNITCYASDIDKVSVSDTKQNLEWLEDKFEVKTDAQKIFEFDASKPGVENMVQEKVDAIVTEPYLGKAMKIAPSNEYVKKMFIDLEEIYIKSLDNFRKILKQNAKIVIVMPKIGEFSLLNKIVDKISSLSYHKISNFNYSRSYQIVKREIVVFEFNK